MKFTSDQEQPLVSVCIIAYNHERYIRAAVDSVLMQETDFPCELIIGEDCSTDGTRAILQSYAKKYPITLLLHQPNVGAMKNWDSVLRAAKGRYVAFFEGDDAWIDPLKLRKQVDILEQHADVAFCYSNAKIHDLQNPDSLLYFNSESRPPTIVNASHVITDFCAPTCTYFFRNLLRQIPEWALKVRGGDYLMMTLLCRHGTAYYIDECLGLYNYHYTGMSKTVPHEQFLVNDFMPWQNVYDYYTRDPEIGRSLAQKSLRDIDKLFHRGWVAEARTLFWKWPLRRVWKVKHLRLSLMKMALKLYTPFFPKLKAALKG